MHISQAYDATLINILRTIKMPHLLDEYAYSFCTFYDKIGKVKINTNYLSSLCKIYVASEDMLFIVLG